MKTRMPFFRLVGLSALNPTLSPRRGSDVFSSSALRQPLRPVPSLGFLKKLGTILPLLGGEGWGEGGCHHHFLQCEFFPVMHQAVRALAVGKPSCGVPVTERQRQVTVSSIPQFRPSLPLRAGTAQFWQCSQKKGGGSSHSKTLARGSLACVNAMRPGVLQSSGALSQGGNCVDQINLTVL